MQKVLRIQMTKKTKLKRKEWLRENQQTVLKPPFYVVKAGEIRSFKDSATKQKLMNKTLEDHLQLEAKKWNIECFRSHGCQQTISIHVKKFRTAEATGGWKTKPGEGNILSFSSHWKSRHKRRLLFHWI